MGQLIQLLNGLKGRQIRTKTVELFLERGKTEDSHQCNWH